MKPIEILQGKWLGHPLHPALVHLPIGAWLAACGLDLFVWFGGSADTAPQLALYAVLFGLAGALLAVPTGVAEWAAIKQTKPAWKLALYHMLLNLVAALAWAANAGLRWTALQKGHGVTAAVLATSVTGTVLVLTGGYLGSLLAFEHGISVARQSKSKWRAIAARAGSRLPEPK